MSIIHGGFLEPVSSCLTIPGAGLTGEPGRSKWGVLWAHGLDQVRIIQDVPEPSYHLAISPRLIRNHKLDGAQRESEKRVAA